MMTPEVLARFEAKVKKLPTGCWEWQASRNVHGYGYFGIGKTCHLAHRVALAHATGRPIPEGMFALHKCDNPPCVNPSHLYVGTPKQNTQDMLTRGRARTARGLQNGRAKLSDSDVADIRIRASLGESCKGIARSLGLDASYVGRIVRGVRR